MKNILYLILLAAGLAVIYNGCSENSTVPPPVNTKSDLTRSGKYISFTSNLTGNYNIYLAQVESNGALSTSALVYPSNPYNLTYQFTGVTNKQSNWSPNGRMLVFTSTQGTAEYVYIFFFNPDGSIDSTISPNPRQLSLLNAGNYWDENASFSPDGKYLIWDRRYDNNQVPNVDTADSRDLYIGSVVDSGANLQINNIHSIMTTLVADEYNPKWAPRISVSRVAYEYRSSTTSTDHDVYVIDPLDSANNVNFYNPNNSGYPAWSPACDNIIFESDKSSGNFWKIVSLSYPTNNGTPADIAQENGVNLRYPTRLPNGDLLSYIRFDLNTGLGNIWIIPSGGGASFKLLQSVPQFEAANNLWPAW